MDDIGNLKEDLNLPEETDDDQELTAKIRAAFDDGREVRVTVLCAMGIEKITDFTDKAN